MPYGRSVAWIESVSARLSESLFGSLYGRAVAVSENVKVPGALFSVPKEILRHIFPLVASAGPPWLGFVNPIHRRIIACHAKGRYPYRGES